MNDNIVFKRNEFKQFLLNIIKNFKNPNVNDIVCLEEGIKNYNNIKLTFCRYCGGTGYLSGYKCKICKGYGLV